MVIDRGSLLSCSVALISWLAARRIKLIKNVTFLHELKSTTELFKSSKKGAHRYREWFGRQHHLALTRRCPH